MFNYIKQIYNKLFNKTNTTTPSQIEPEKRMWVTNGKVAKLIPQSQLSEYVSNGYKRGRKIVK